MVFSPKTALAYFFPFQNIPITSAEFMVTLAFFSKKPLKTAKNQFIIDNKNHY
jgi:hypothetical protein